MTNKRGLWQAYNNLGVLQRDVGAMADALAAYDKCLELTPDSRNAGAADMPCSGGPMPALILSLIMCGVHVEIPQSVRQPCSYVPAITRRVVNLSTFPDTYALQGRTSCWR